MVWWRLLAYRLALNALVMTLPNEIRVYTHPHSPTSTLVPLQRRGFICVPFSSLWLVEASYPAHTKFSLESLCREIGFFFRNRPCFFFATCVQKKLSAKRTARLSCSRAKPNKKSSEVYITNPTFVVALAQLTYILEYSFKPVISLDFSTGFIP